jgi:hypothetical protein
VNIIAQVKEHPVIAGVAVFGVGFIALSALGLLGGGNSGNGAAVQSYFAAQSAQAQAGDAVQIASIQAQAATTQTQLNDTAATNIQTTWAQASTTQGAQNAAAQEALAPYAAYGSIAGDIASVAALPPLTTTTSTQSKSSGGLFGFLLGGGGSSASTTTKQTANPNATNAISQLEALLQGFGNPGGFHSGS